MAEYDILKYQTTWRFAMYAMLHFISCTSTKTQIQDGKEEVGWSKKEINQIGVLQNFCNFPNCEKVSTLLTFGWGVCICTCKSHFW